MIDSNDKQFIDTNELSIHQEALRTPRMVESQYEALKTRYRTEWTDRTNCVI